MSSHKKSNHNRPAGYSKERADYWCVTLRVMQQWLKKKSVPVDDDAKMVEWYALQPIASQGKLSPSFRRRITEIRVALTNSKGTGSVAGGGTSTADPDYVAFEAAYAGAHQATADATALADLKKQFQFFLFKQRVCTERNDHAGADHATKQLTQLSSIIHDMELRDQKLGRDLGDLVPRSTLEATARTIGYHLLRCADTTIAEIASVLTRRDPSGAPLLAEEIRAGIEPILLNHYILQPILRASHGANPAAPPAWLIAALRLGLTDVLEPSTIVPPLAASTP